MPSAVPPKPPNRTLPARRLASDRRAEAPREAATRARAQIGEVALPADSDPVMKQVQEIYELHSAMVRRRVISLMGKSPLRPLMDSEDLLDSVFLRLTRDLRKGTVIRDVPAYLHSAAQDEFTQEVRKLAHPPSQMDDI